MDERIQPVFVDSGGNKYYLGTPANPYNVYPDVSFPMFPVEAERLILEGGVVAPCQRDVESPPNPKIMRARIEDYNKNFAASLANRRHGKLLLDL